jgi:DNA-binding CsgD family transcriptional regulator
VRVVVVLERNCTRAVDISQWSAEHRLTSRERETVSFLLKGLTSEEIANEMRISPSTVKSFLKLVMVKVGASNRTGIVAKVHEETRDDQALRRRSDEVGLPGNGDHQ